MGAPEKNLEEQVRNVASSWAFTIAQNDKGLTQEEQIVLGLYEALNARDARQVQAVIAEDLEWWFHGPPSQRHLMRMLTGVDPLGTFAFVPLSVCTISSNKVLVEGKQDSSEVCWVHAWTLKDGSVTQLREYFNTTLTVTDTSFNMVAYVPSQSHNCSIIWQSKLSDSIGKSFPGLVLAI